ncbi:25S rRNA (adenine2142-N1)-methyltransferase [Martiniozyma asiatica (nom. inval.)]|nr:25S rRNA (adenine2142-N1)-methyltransferase [Martiniozyma asiatica]
MLDPQNQHELDDGNYLPYIQANYDYKEIYSKSFEKVKIELKINKTPPELGTPAHGARATQLIEVVKQLGAIDAEIEKRGGLETYQRASTLGQDKNRGGDSSRILIPWLHELNFKGKSALEIGCLSSKNYISTCGIFDAVTKIDLHSQEPSILEEDFLKRPLPKSKDEKFDCISCSLVLNFVPNATDRGDMIDKFGKFLKGKGGLVFLVLPAPCITNSRYMTKEVLLEIFTKFGYTAQKEKITEKLVYWLFEWNGDNKAKGYQLKKRQLRTGNDRNNFSIIIQ